MNFQMIYIEVSRYEEVTFLLNRGRLMYMKSNSH